MRILTRTPAFGRNNGLPASNKTGGRKSLPGRASSTLMMLMFLLVLRRSTIAIPVIRQPEHFKRSPQKRPS